jgi:hypothetical protein
MTLYSKRANNYGINTNVELDPAAVSTVQNQITINTAPSEIKPEYPPTDNPPDVQPILRSPYTVPPAENIEPVETKLLKIFSDILLSQNRTLLTNILTKKAIILAKKDLESIISTKINAQCTIELGEPKLGCLKKISSLRPIEAIRIDLHDGPVSFKHVYNSDYLIFQDTYHISMKYCLDIK